MFVFSDVTDCDYDPKAKEILVFSEDSSQHNVSLYKIRAVLRSDDDGWVGILKDGRKGYIIHTTELSYSTYKVAIDTIMQYLLSSIISNTLSVFPKLSKITTVEEKFWDIVNTLTKNGIGVTPFNINPELDSNLFLILNIYKNTSLAKNKLIIALSSNKTKIQLNCDVEGSDIVSKINAWQPISSVEDVIKVINDLPADNLILPAIILRY